MRPGCRPSPSTFALAILAVLALSLGVRAWGQSGTPAPAQVEAYRAAYRDLLRQPLDLARLYRFAELALEVGEPRVAARALGRVLLTNPALTAVRVRLGILYYDLGERALARAELLKARDDRTAPPQVLATAERYLAAIEGHVPRQDLVARVELGLRYQSNGTAGPSDDRILFRDQRRRVPDSAKKADDEDFYALVQLKHAYRLEAERPTAWESTLDAYLSQRLEQERLSFLSLVGTSGLRFGSADGERSLRPHLVASYEGLNRTTYGGGAGLGLEGSARLSPSTLADFLVTGSYWLFNDTGRWEENSDHQGPRLDATAGLTFELGPGTALGLAVLGGRSFAAKPAQANNRLGLELRLSQSFAAPWGVTSRPWSASLGGQWVHRWHDDPDHDIDSNTSRRDDLLRVFAGASVPLGDSVSLVVRGGYTHNASNIRNYQWAGYDVAAGIGIAF